MIPKSSGQNIQMIVIQPLYSTKTKKEKDSDGNKIVIETDKFVKEHYMKVWMNKNDVGLFGEYIGSKGQIVKSRTRIFNRLTSSYSNVAHSIKELEQILIPSRIGFKTRSNEIQ